MKAFNFLSRGKNDSSNKVVLYNLSSKILLNGINFFITPIFTRMLGTENYGMFSLYLTWQNVLLILIGMQSQSVIGNASMRYGKDERNRLFSSNAFLCMIVSFGTCVFILLFHKSLSEFIGMPTIILLYMLLHAYTNYGVNIITHTWSFDKEARKNFFFSVILSISNIIFSLALVESIHIYKYKYIGRIIGSSMPTIVFGIVCLFLIFKRGKTFYNKNYWNYTLKFCLPIMFHSLSNIILSQSDRVMLNSMSTLKQVGIYSLTYTLVNVLTIIWEAFNTAWTPFLYDDLKNDNKKALAEMTNNYVALYTKLTLGFLLVAPEVMMFFGGKEYAEGVFVIPFLAVGQYFVYLYSFPINYKYFHAKTTSIAVGTVLSGGINVMLNYFLISRFGIVGAAIATMISYFLLFMFHYIGALKITEKSYPFKIKMFIPYIALVLLTAILSYSIFREWSIIRWGIAVFVGVSIVWKIIKTKKIW